MLVGTVFTRVHIELTWLMYSYDHAPFVVDLTESLFQKQLQDLIFQAMHLKSRQLFKCQVLTKYLLICMRLRIILALVYETI